MAGRGGFEAIPRSEVRRLLARPDEERWEFVHEGLKARFGTSMDKAWVTIHRALSDGTLHGALGEPPLANAVLGDHLICQTEVDDFVYLKYPGEVAKIARSFRGLGRKGFEAKVATLRGDAGDTARWGLASVPDDLEYVWPYYQAMRAFYRRAAAEKLAVVFYWG
jgi:hypothetical protein